MRSARKEEIEALKEKYPNGSRVKLLQMDDVQAPPIGGEGTVYGVDDTGSILVHWDNGSWLNVIFGIDRITKVEEKRYEKLTAWKDPYDIMCGKCPMHEYETWSPVTMDELKDQYEMDKEDHEDDPYMQNLPDTFEEWLSESIKEGWIREADA